jgi:hypothetical protein
MSKLRVAYEGHDFFVPRLRAILGNQSANVVLCLTRHAADNYKYIRQLS